MRKDDIIKNLCQQNEEIKQERDLWKNKYYQLKAKYKQLEGEKNNGTRSPSIKNIQYSAQEEYQHQQTQILDYDTAIVATDPSPGSSPTLKAKKQEKTPPSPSKQASPHKKMQNQLSNDFDFFSKESLSVPQLDKAICELIEGCFIIQKNSSIDHFDPIRLAFPQNKYIKLRNMFDIIYRYIFVNDHLIQIHDDEFDSRKNQILFGSPCQDFQFVFDNLSENEGEKGRLNQFEKSTNIMRKRYIYGVVLPEIVKQGQQFFQTQLAYGFLSHVPFPNFFKDLNRIVQQQVKYRMLNMQKTSMEKSQKLQIISETIRHITTKSLEKRLVVTDYPVNLELKANICGLKLIYSSKNSFISDQFSHIESLIPKFSLQKLIKLLHYVLAEQNVIVVCRNRKKLNRIFQIIRNIIYPFNWIFPIIYFYSPFFQPFLNSPLPILIGHIENDHPEEDQDKNGYKQQPLPPNEFIKIYIEDDEKKDENQVAGYSKRIKKVYKKLFKQQKTPSKGLKGVSQLLQKPISQRVTSKIFEYIRKLRQFIQSGQIDQEMDDFLIQFIQTQMVSYYKETRQEQQKK